MAKPCPALGRHEDHPKPISAPKTLNRISATYSMSAIGSLEKKTFPSIWLEITFQVLHICLGNSVTISATTLHTLSNCFITSGSGLCCSEPVVRLFRLLCVPGHPCGVTNIHDFQKAGDLSPRSVASRLIVSWVLLLSDERTSQES